MKISAKLGPLPVLAAAVKIAAAASGLKFRLGWLRLGTVLIISTTFVHAQAPNPGCYSPEQFDIGPSIGDQVTMRDGVHLSVDIYMPAVPGKYAVVLTITPYGTETDSSGLRRTSKWFAKRGYVAVIADTRGRYDSEGKWDPFNPKQKTDGYDLVEWIARQEWCTGSVGMWGPSYMGWETWWTAEEAPPHLKAIVAEAAPPDQFRDTVYQDGVISAWLWGWVATVAGRTYQMERAEPYDEFLEHNPKMAANASYVDLNRLRGVMDAPWFDTLMRNNLWTAGYWRAIAYQTPEGYSKVAVPSLSENGWFDHAQSGGPTNYKGMKRFGATPEARRPHLVIGPWPHWPVGNRVLGGIDYGPDAKVDWEGYTIRWFDHYLKGIDNGVEKDPPVTVFIMGANKWRTEKDWPLPQTQWTKYYLDSQGKANSFKGDGVLELTVPQSNSADSYIYDPAHPTVSPKGFLGDGSPDTRLSAVGDDVLIYQTPPLKMGVEVVGPIEAVLYATTSAKDTDWFERLVDVQPDGRSLLLADGALRARSRDPDNEGRYNSTQLSSVEPGRVYQYTIQFCRTTGNLFLPGHRIRVEISSSWYPFFAPNLNTGADNLALVPMSTAVVAKQTIMHGPKYPSHILLPVIQSRE